MSDKYIATIGARIRVTPWDDVYIRTKTPERCSTEDRTPFDFRVEGRLEDGQIFYGLYGPVISGPDRYKGLICNVIVREDGTDWRKEVVSGANFKVAKTMVTRDHRYDFRHPEGTTVNGCPLYSTFGEIRVIEDT